ncbi:MAG: zinc-dependent alcohol dehydrogenase [Candidatus Thorarchaeota archaeon]
MKSLVLTHDGLQIADTPVPAIMPGNVRIEVRSVGISRTDMKIWKGDLEVKLPLILGHEFTGIVHDSSDPEICEGSLVTAEANISCNTCWYCRQNQSHLCNGRLMLGRTTDGALAEYLTIPADIVHVLPEGVDAQSGTFTEPLASAIETYARTSLQPDEDVLILGTGKAGLLIAQVYDAFGANVHLLGDNKWHLGLAKQLGLRNIVNKTEPDWKERIMNSTHGVGPRVVVEATGTAEGINEALDIVRNGGVVALTGMSEETTQFDSSAIVKRELTVLGSSKGSYDMALTMLGMGRIEVKRLITKEFALENGTDAFEYATRPEVVKVKINI